jgi:hypothetical protein
MCSVDSESSLVTFSSSILHFSPHLVIASFFFFFPFLPNTLQINISPVMFQFGFGIGMYVSVKVNL